MADGVVSVCWKDHTSELATVYKNLLQNNFLVDCTLSAEGQSIKAHRLVLSACSPYFQMLFREETGGHPIIILLDASYEILKAMIDFMYQGETQISEWNLKEFLALGQSLQIKGLNAFSKDYKNRNLSCGTANDQGASESKQNTCKGQNVCASQKDRPENYSQQHPHNSKVCPGAALTVSSDVAEQGGGQYEEEPTASEVTPSKELQISSGSEEMSVDSEITVKVEPLFPEFPVLEPRNEILDRVKCNEAVSGNGMSGMEGRINSVCGEQDLNQFSSCSDSSRGNTELSAMPPSQWSITHLSNEGSSVQDVVEGDGPLLSTILIPKREHLDNEEWEESIDDLGVPNEMDERTELTNPDPSSSAAGLMSENDQATQLRSGGRVSALRAESPPLASHEGRAADQSRISGEEPVFCEAATSFPVDHSRQRQHCCDVCAAAFPSPSALSVHRRSHTGERPYRCEFCDASFAKSSVLVSHRRKHTGERPFACEVCGASFTKSSVLVSHRRMHTGERPFRCDACGVSFAQAATLANHKRTHTGERPFGCGVCGVAFTQQSTLTQHARMHTGERAHRCEVCGKAFVSKVDLVRHMRTHTGERPFRCDVCGVAFAQVCTLANHTRTHTGERPYRCDVCGSAFAHANTLAVHVRTHTGERPFVCEVCGKAFSSKRNLGCHMRTHTGERPFRCDVCGKDFSSRSSFTYHKRTHDSAPQ